MLDQQMREYLMNSPVIRRAYENLELARMNKADCDELERRETWLPDQGALDYALTEGLAKGLSQDSHTLATTL